MQSNNSDTRNHEAAWALLSLGYSDLSPQIAAHISHMDSLHVPYDGRMAYSLPGQTSTAQGILQQAHEYHRLLTKLRIGEGGFRIYLRPSGAFDVCTGLARCDDDRSGHCASITITPEDTDETLHTAVSRAVDELLEEEL